MKKSTLRERIFGAPIFPSKREVGYGLQGLAVGLVIGSIANAPTHPSEIMEFAFIILVVIGSRLIRSSPAL
jgi:hypothetical protein